MGPIAEWRLHKQWNTPWDSSRTGGGAESVLQTDTGGSGGGTSTSTRATRLLPTNTSEGLAGTFGTAQCTGAP